MLKNEHFWSEITEEEKIWAEADEAAAVAAEVLLAAAVVAAALLVVVDVDLALADVRDEAAVVRLWEAVHDRVPHAPVAAAYSEEVQLPDKHLHLGDQHRGLAHLVLVWQRGRC